jgi:hypothetical protein
VTSLHSCLLNKHHHLLRYSLSLPASPYPIDPSYISPPLTSVDPRFQATPVLPQVAVVVTLHLHPSLQFQHSVILQHHLQSHVTHQTRPLPDNFLRSILYRPPPHTSFLPAVRYQWWQRLHPHTPSRTPPLLTPRPLGPWQTRLKHLSHGAVNGIRHNNFRFRHKDQYEMNTN